MAGRRHPGNLVARQFDANGVAFNHSGQHERKGNCYDNAAAQSFYSTLEFDLVMQSGWRTRDEARSAVFE